MATSTTPRTTASVSPGGRPAGRGTPPDRGTPADRGTPPDRGLAPGRGAPRDRGAPPRTRPVGAPRHTRPLTGLVTRPAEPAVRPAARPATRPAVRPATRPAAHPATRPPARPELARARVRHPRAPFILLLVGLLGGALISLLVISTTLAEGSYQISGLQQQNASLAKQEQLLTQQVAQDAAPAQIAQEAEELGMRPNPNLQFIDVNTGKVVAGHPSAAQQEIDVPGYTP
jgi:hypothetical protein